MRERFLDFIKKHALVLPGERVLLAVSGGVDSMTLLTLFSQSEIPFGVAHCNFNLRGEASDQDEALTRRVAEGLGVPFFSRRFKTKSYAASKGISTQMAARDLRYDWFDQLCRDEGYQKVATAHHLDDSLETVLLNLVRGTSIAGLRGILPINDKVIRPLLDFTKHELTDWALEQGVKWREDASNQETDYQRNLIRHEVVPKLEMLNPDLLGTFRNTLSRNREVEQVFLSKVAKVRNEALTESEGVVYIRKDALTGSYLLERLIRPFGFNYTQAGQILEAVDGISGKEFISDSHHLVLDRESLVITPLSLEQEAFEIDENDREVYVNGVHYSVKLVPAAGLVATWKTEQNALLDMNKLVFPLKVRSWQEGDAFYPLGMTGKKKLSDFMIDRKIPVNLKNRVSVVVSGSEIVWVAGMRIDNRYKISPDTSTVFCLIQQ